MTYKHEPGVSPRTDCPAALGFQSEAAQGLGLWPFGLQGGQSTARNQLSRAYPGGHSSGGEAGNVVFKINATYSNHIHLVGRVV